MLLFLFGIFVFLVGMGSERKDDKVLHLVANINHVALAVIIVGKIFLIMMGAIING